VSWLAPESTTLAAIGTTSRAGVRVAKALVLSLLWLSLTVAFSHLPSPAEPGIDPSWRSAIQWFFDQKVQYGRDLVFTLGPLGFLLHEHYIGAHLWMFLLWQVGIAMAFAAVVIAQGRRLPPVRAGVFFVAFFVIGWTPDALYLVIVAFLGWYIVGSTRPAGLAAAAALSVLGLIKFTNLLLAAAAIAAGVGIRFASRRHRDAAVLLATFSAAVLGGWLLAGQQPQHLPAYLADSWHLSQGYNDAMALPTPPGILVYAVAVVALLVAYAVIHLVVHADKPHALACSAVLAGFIAIAWKHGVVRADYGHLLAFFTCALVPAITFPAALRDSRHAWKMQQAFLFIAAIIALVGIHQVTPGGFLNPLERTRGQAAVLAHVLTDPVGYADGLRHALSRRQQLEALPRVRESVGDAPVDVIGWDQGVALLNGLNYVPRPAFQSYSAYTPELAARNEAFYRSPRAPTFVLLRVHTVDDRLAALDDGPILRVLSDLYHYVLTEGRFELWKRRVSPIASQVTTIPVTLAAPFNSPVDVRAFSEEPLWMTVDVRLTVLGRLMALVYKTPPITLTVTDTEGRPSEFRLPIGQARTGFIVNPLVVDTASYALFTGGFLERRAAQISLRAPSGSWRVFDPVVQLQLLTLPRPTFDVTALSRATALRYHMFRDVPTSASAALPPTEAFVDGRSAMLMGAPSSMTFDIPSGAQQLSGAFGYVEGAYQNGGRTDGASFTASCDDRNRRTVLFSRALMPASRDADRGLQEFTVPLSCRQGQVHLDVAPGSAGDASWDWTVWTGIAFK
jgi:hypothetical protein